MPDKADFEVEQWFESGLHFTSVVNKIEVLSFQAPEEDFRRMLGLFDKVKILPLSDEIAARTIEIRQQIKIKLPDGIVAASALHHGVTLVTRNISDFKKIPGLVVINPHDFWP